MTEMKQAQVKRYVAGFLFDEAEERVLLVRKKQPEWMAGLWNAIGGKIEKDETPQMAMEREFQEETGGHGLAWTLFAVLGGPEFRVWFFRAQTDDPTPFRQLNDVGEEMTSWTLVDLFYEQITTIPNLRWLIPMALSKGYREWPYQVWENAIVDPTSL